MIEPLQGEGGVRAAPPAFFKALSTAGDTQSTLASTDQGRPNPSATSLSHTATAKSGLAVKLSSHTAMSLAPYSSLRTRNSSTMRSREKYRALAPNVILLQKVHTPGQPREASIECDGDLLERAELVL